MGGVFRSVDNDGEVTFSDRLAGQTVLGFALKRGHADVAELLSAANPAPTATAPAAARAASPAGPRSPEQRKSP